MKRGILSGFFCHGKKERCFKIRGWTLPICSRCFGFYFGISVGLLFSSLLSIFANGISPAHLFLISLLALIPFGMDGILQELTSWESSNPLRFFTGILLGTVIGMDIYWLIFGVN
ncbi:MAG: DUF2085 domain-containing protein [Candidatus Saliniplasma sp.]